MKGLFIFFFIFLLVVGGAIITVYYFYEKPIQEVNNQIFCNLSISALDHNDKVRTGYNIVGLGVNISGETSSIAYSRESVVANSSFVIYTYNLDNQTYYTSYISIDKCDESIIRRIDINLIPYGKVNIDSTGSIASGDPINLNVTITGKIQSPELCISWPVAIVTINPEESLERADVPSRLDTVNKCYSLGGSIIDSSKLIKLSYSKFGTLLDSDYLSIFLIDADYRYLNNTALLVSEMDGKDIGLPDYELKIV